MLHDIDPERREVVGGAGAADARPRRVRRRRLEVTDDLDARASTAPTPCCIQIRVGGQAARLPTRRSRSPAAASARRRPARAAWPRRCGPSRSCSTSPSERARGAPPRRLDRRLHQPGRDRHPRAARRRPPRDRPVQRGDRLPAPVRRAARRRPRDRVLVDQVGLNHLTWVRAVRARRRATCCPTCSPTTATSWPHEIELPAGAARRARRDPVLLPALLLRRTTRCSREQRDGARRGPRRSREIERELLELYRDPALDEKPALLEQRGGAFYSEAATQLVALAGAGDGDAQVVDVRNGGTLRRAGRRRRRRGARADRAAGPQPLPQPPLAPELLGLVQHVAAYERLAARAAVAATAARARRALLTHPLVGQWELAGRAARPAARPRGGAAR